MLVTLIPLVLPDRSQQELGKTSVALLLLRTHVDPKLSIGSRVMIVQRFVCPGIECCLQNKISGLSRCDVGVRMRERMIVGVWPVRHRVVIHDMQRITNIGNDRMFSSVPWLAARARGNMKDDCAGCVMMRLPIRVQLVAQDVRCRFSEALACESK